MTKKILFYCQAPFDYQLITVKLVMIQFPLPILRGSSSSVSRTCNYYANIINKITETVIILE